MPTPRPNGAAVEQRLVPAILFDVARVLADDLRILQLAEVIEDVAQLDFPEPVDLGAVRIAFFVRERMMLAMDGDPLTRHDAGGHPDAEPEHPFDRGV